MRLGALVKTPGRVRRLTQIMSVLAKHGFGHLVHRMRLQHFLLPAQRLRRHPLVTGKPRPETMARRIAVALEELGPTFVKLGQILSTRPDLIPEEYIAEFKKLQDRVRPFDSNLARETVQKELGRPIAEVFSYFSPEPFASVVTSPLDEMNPSRRRSRFVMAPNVPTP